MQVYQTEEEQIEAIKRWWRDYGKSIVLGIILALVFSFGWRYWQQRQMNETATASLLYQQVLADAAQQKNDELQKIADLLVADYPRTAYATAAAFLLAQQYVNGANFALAQQKLQWVMDHGVSPQFKQVARLRIARLLLAQKKFNEALSTLQNINDKNYLTRIEEIKGDIFLAMGDKGKAHVAYQTAFDALPKLPSGNPLLKMKLEQFAVQNK